MSTVKIDITSFPDDVDTLKRMLIKSQRFIAELEEYIRLQKLQRFAAKSEYSVDQVEMFNEAELCEAAEQALIEQEAIIAPANETKRRRRPLPAKLPRVRVEHDIDESEKLCACGCQRQLIDEVVSEELDIVPAQIRVLQNVRKKYACPNCEQGVVTAPLPAQPILKSNASPNLLAHLVVGKYQDALPLYRQEMILARHGVELPRNTLESWIIKAGQIAQPLINLMQDELNKYPVLHCDETTVQVLKEDGKTAQSKSYM